jgi:GTPase SAR1 family protein
MDRLAMPGAWSTTDSLTSLQPDIDAYEYEAVAELEAAPISHSIPRVAPPSTAHSIMVPLPTTRVKPPANSSNYNPLGFASPSIEQIRHKPIIIVVFGQTGAGKTSFIKAATGEDLKIGHDLSSCTNDVRPVACRFENQDVCLVDTPGFSDTHLSDTQVLTMIASWLKNSYDEGALISGIIYLHPINHNRMDGPSMRNLDMMMKLCGKQSLKNVVLASTMWENVSVEDGERRENDLKFNYWKDMIEFGCKTARVEKDTEDIARDLVRSLLGNKPTATKLQQELSEGKELTQTGAGIAVSEEITRIEKKLRAELEETKRSLAAANQIRYSKSERKHALRYAKMNADADEIKRKIAALEQEKLMLKTWKPKSLPRVQSLAGLHYIFKPPIWECSKCKKKTHKMGDWQCEGCRHWQRNVW